MRFNIQKALAKIDKEHKRRAQWYKVVGALAAIVVFCTVYALILPAITLESDKAAENGVFTEGAAVENTAVEAGDAAIDETEAAAETSEEAADGEIIPDENVTAEDGSEAAANEEQSAAGGERIAEDEAADKEAADPEKKEEEKIFNEGTLSGSNGTYDVEVLYGADAKIPENAKLRVSALTVDSNEYAEAKESVIADKKARDRSFDEEEMGFAALDITIVDENGNEIEPAEGAEVTVSIKLNKLPGDVSEEELAGSMEIQHLNESSGTTEVETVAKVQDVMVADGTAEAEFKVDSFSTYTITWQGAGRGTNNSTATLNFRSGNTNHAAVTVHYVDENGTAITRPGNNSFSASPNPANNQITSYNLEQTALFGNITGWSYVGTYRDAARTQPITEIQVGRGSAVPGNNIRSIAFFNGDEQIGNTVAVANGTANGGDIYVVYSNSAREVTVHFVDRDGNELTDIKDPNGNVIDNGTIEISASNSPIDLSEYTKDGYTYANTRILGHGDNGRIIHPNIRINNGNLQCSTDSNNSSTTYNRNFQNGEEVYVVLDPEPSGGSGGGGGGSGGDTIPDLPAPENSKTLTDNHDGTYDLNLSITGKSDSKQENKNINVLFVIDNSSSMGSGAGSRLENTKTAVIDSAEELLKNNTEAFPELVEVAAISFDASADEECGWTSTKSTFDDAINDISTGNGTNWEDGLKKALDYGTGDGDPTYVIFFTDGMPYGYRGLNNDGTAVETYKSCNSNYCAMQAAKDEARAIVNSGRTLYGIFAYGSTSDYNADYLGSLVEYAYNDNSERDTYYKTAADSDDVAKALAEIVDSITQKAGFTNVELTDGITGLTHSALVNGQAGEFRYYRSGGKNEDGTNKYSTTANEGRGEEWNDAPPASYSDATGVTWDLGDLMLEDGVTYTVSFTVWPDQDAYDTVADLNNSQDPQAAYEALSDDLKAQIVNNGDGTFSLKTNTEAKASYTTIKTKTEKSLPDGAVPAGTDKWTYTDKDGRVWEYVRNSDGTYTGTTTQDNELTYDDVPAISLDKTTMKVRKIWKDDLTSAEDRPVSVDFEIYEDGNEYWSVHLSDENDWEQEINIAPGIYVTPGDHDTAASGDAAGIMEGAEGHVYTIAETGYSYEDKDGNVVHVDGVENHYDFETAPVQPMLNGTTTDDEEDMIEYLTKTEWDAGEAALTATNTVKDGIYIYKKVLADGQEIDCDAEFTFKVTLKDAEGNPVYTEGQGQSGDLAWRIDKKDSSSGSGYAEDSRGYYTNTDGTVTLTMAADGRIRIVNVPVGTVFTVEEVTDDNPNGYEYLNSKINDAAATTDNKATDTTVGNKQWAVTVTNERNALNVDLLKVDVADASTTLAGAQFELYTDENCTQKATDSEGEEIGTITSGSDGKAAIGQLLTGVYYLKETKAPSGYNVMTSPVKITVNADSVTAIQGGAAAPVEKSDDGLTYTITATNSAGSELPMTGGPGTLIYTLGGMLLMASAALMYGFRNKRAERRSK